MRNYIYDPTQIDLTEVTDTGEQLTAAQRIGNFVGRIVGAETNQDAVDRTSFFATSSELEQRADTIGVEIASPEDKDAFVIKLPRDARLNLDNHGKPVLSEEELQRYLSEGSKTGNAIRKGIEEARAEATESAYANSWWLTYEDTDTYEYNPFSYDPTEQFIIGEGTSAPVTIHNFGAPIRPSQLEQITFAVDNLAQFTNGYSKYIVPNIVIHQAFALRHFTRTNTHSRPAGLAWQGEPFIDINRETLEGRDGSVGQTWLEQLVTHELHHQIDAHLNPGLADFSRFFRYVDVDGDAIIDRVVPVGSFAGSNGRKHRIIDSYDKKTIEESEPCDDYGYTNAAEDLATTSEEVPFGGDVDPIRRDVYMHILQDFVTNYEKIMARTLGPRHPNYQRLNSDDVNDHPIVVPTLGYPSLFIARRTGSDILLPTSSLSKPLKIAFAHRPTLRRQLRNLLD